MEKEKIAKLKRTALIAGLSCIPALTSSLITYFEVKSSAEAANIEIKKEAEAGFQFSRAAYEKMITDVATMKAEIRMMRALLFTPAGEYSGHFPEFDEEEVSASGSLAAYEDKKSEEKTIRVKKPEGDYLTVEQGQFPENLNSAQKMLGK